MKIETICALLSDYVYSRTLYTPPKHEAAALGGRPW